MRRTRLFGATGTVLMAIGALGVGARPVVQDPTFGVRLLNLPSRIQTVSLTMTTTGAVMMALAWLMLGRFALGERRMSRSQLDRTLLLWVLPLLIAPPMYSRDVYSYLAQSEIAIKGLDPYRVGPAPGLGLDHVFTLSVPNMWRETPAPYGPLFLWIGQGISAITGENIVAAVLCHRLVVLLGVGLIVWATPRLARRCGVAEVSALWLGAANPLLIMHLVAGIHNEALMLGLMLAGTEFALRGIDAARPLIPKPLAWPQDPEAWARWRPSLMLLIGVVLITMSSQVKLPSLLALGFVAMALACRWGGTFKAFLLAGGSLTAVSVAVMALIGWASGLGFGWLFTLGTANVVRSWMSLPTLAGAGHRTGRDPARAGRPHHRGARPHPCHRCRHHRDPGDLAAAGRASRTAAPGRRTRRRARVDRAAVSGGPALVRALGGHPARGVGHSTRVPHDDHRGHARRGHFRSDGQRRPVHVVPDPAGSRGEHGDRGCCSSAHLQPSAVAQMPAEDTAEQPRRPPRRTAVATADTAGEARRLR